VVKERLDNDANREVAVFWGIDAWNHSQRDRCSATVLKGVTLLCSYESRLAVRLSAKVSVKALM